MSNETRTSQAEHGLRGSATLLRLARHLELHRNELAHLEDVPPDKIASPHLDENLRKRRWGYLFQDELEFVLALRNRLVHSPASVKKAELDEALEAAKRLEDLWFADSTSRRYLNQWVAVVGRRVVDHDDDAAALARRVADSGRPVDLMYRVEE